MEKFNLQKVKEISKIKNEPKWMTDFRINAFKKFEELSNPKFGPELKINFNEITYYKKIQDKVSNDWNEVQVDAKNTFEELGLPKAEKEYLENPN